MRFINKVEEPGQMIFPAMSWADMRGTMTQTSTFSTQPGRAAAFRLQHTKGQSSMHVLR